MRKTKKTLPVTCNQIFVVSVIVLIALGISGNYMIWDLTYKASNGGIWFGFALLCPVVAGLMLLMKLFFYIESNYKCRCDKK